MSKLRIERLDLDMRGIPPATAEAAARLLGPALRGALARRRLGSAASGAHLDAGRLDFRAAADAASLAGGIAERIARKTTRG